MKRLYYIATLCHRPVRLPPIQAQEEAGNTQQQQQRRRGPEASRGAREEEKKENGMPELTVRAHDMNERMTRISATLAGCVSSTADRPYERTECSSILSHPTDERADELVLDHLPAGMRRQVVRL